MDQKCKLLLLQLLLGDRQQDIGAKVILKGP